MHTTTSLLARITQTGPGAHDVNDPATGDVIGSVAFDTPDAVAGAVASARAAQPAWAMLDDGERVEALLRIADVVEENADALAHILSQEQGKPLNGPNARFEVQACSGWLRATAATPQPVEVLVDDDQTHAEIRYRPVGVVGVITPWNWPMMIATWQIGPALRMGNAVVAKPSEYTTLSGLALYELFQSELPAGVLTVVTGGGDVGAALASNAGIGKLMFTGSTRTGQRIVEASAANLTRLTLELGGNDAGILLPDVDPVAVAEDIFWGAFINTGQTCAALKRLYVPDAIYDQVVEALAEVSTRTPMGVGLDEQNVLGPLQNHMQWEVVNRLVEDAKSRGAQIVVGGDPDVDAPGHFYPTTLVADIENDAPLVQEEQFGPALPIIRYTDLEQAISWANGVDVGLGASVWSSDIEEARRLAARIEAGTVWINSHGGVNPMVPFGGVKHSGYGLEFGVEGLKSVALPQVVSG